MKRDIGISDQQNINLHNITGTFETGARIIFKLFFRSAQYVISYYIL